eukprot:COSAG06_NODE_27748_length_587_cov_0.797131_1_plen_102_part_10
MNNKLRKKAFAGRFLTSDHPRRSQCEAPSGERAPTLVFECFSSKYVCPEPVLVKWWRFQYSKTAAARKKKGCNFSCLAVDAKVIDVGACINSRVRSFLNTRF